MPQHVRGPAELKDTLVGRWALCHATLVKCQQHCTWPSNILHIFSSLWLKCGLAHTSLPKNPWVFMCISAQGAWALWQLPKHPSEGRSSVAIQESAPHMEHLALHRQWGGRQEQLATVSSSSVHSVACHEDWACSRVFLCPCDSRIPPWPHWTPRHAWSQSCPMASCSTMVDTYTAVQRGSRAEKVLLRSCCPLIRASTH